MQKLTCESVYSVRGYEAFRCTLEENGSVETRTIGIDDFVNLIRGSVIIRQEAIKINLGHMPKGYINGTVSTNGDFEVLIKAEEKIRCMRHYDNAFLIPFPKLLFLIRKGGRSLSGYVWAITDDDITEGTLLYNYPFGNVSTDGRICFGNILHSFKNIEDMQISDADKLVDAFFDASTNDDYWDAKKKAPNFKRQLDLLKDIDRKDKYPSNCLVKSGVDFKKIKLI